MHRALAFFELPSVFPSTTMTPTTIEAVLNQSSDYVGVLKGLAAVQKTVAARSSTPPPSRLDPDSPTKRPWSPVPRKRTPTVLHGCNLLISMYDSCVKNKPICEEFIYEKQEENKSIQAQITKETAAIVEALTLLQGIEAVVAKQKEMEATTESNESEVVVQTSRLKIMECVKPMALNLRHTADTLGLATVEAVHKFVSYALHWETGSVHLTEFQQIKNVPRSALVEVMRIFKEGGYADSPHFPRSAFRDADGSMGKGANLNTATTSRGKYWLPT